MSVELYTNKFFSGFKLILDIGEYDFIKNKLAIQSFVIIDNVNLSIEYDDGHIDYCGPQSKSVVNNNKFVKKITIKYSVCDPYNNLNCDSIMNRYGIGRNFSIKYNKKLTPISPETNEKNGFVDFWYNNDPVRNNNILYEPSKDVYHQFIKNTVVSNNIANCKTKNNFLRCKPNGLVSYNTYNLFNNTTFCDNEDKKYI